MIAACNASEQSTPLPQDLSVSPTHTAFLPIESQTQEKQSSLTLITPSGPTETAPPTRSPTPTLPPTITPSPTPDTRLFSEDWRRWPVVPVISPWIIDLYSQGLEQGNDPHTFSKVGDCQNIPEAFLGIYDLPGRYRLSENNAHLQETIDYFSGSFGRDSIAVDAGFNFPAIFSPLRADPELCTPVETPLICELRIHNPSIVIISLEIWYKGRTVENYEGYLRQAVEYAIEQKVIPILATKADNVEGNHRFNLATARVAYDYDVPLWNFWLAVQPLPNHGMDAERDDGFHISVDGWNMRSSTALQTLDAILRALNQLPSIDS
jgi:hypothetical protein